MKRATICILSILFVFSSMIFLTSYTTTDGTEIVYITDYGTKYHTENCGSLWNSSNKITLEKATQQGYKPCNRCNPPVLEETYTYADNENEEEIYTNDNDSLEFFSQPLYYQVSLWIILGLIIVFFIVIVLRHYISRNKPDYVYSTFTAIASFLVASVLIYLYALSVISSGFNSVGLIVIIMFLILPVFTFIVFTKEAKEQYYEYQYEKLKSNPRKTDEEIIDSLIAEYEDAQTYANPRTRTAITSRDYVKLQMMKEKINRDKIENIIELVRLPNGGWICPKCGRENGNYDICTSCWTDRRDYNK